MRKKEKKWERTKKRSTHRYPDLSEVLIRRKLIQIFTILLIIVLIILFSGTILAITDAIYERISINVLFTHTLTTQSILETIIYVILNGIAFLGGILMIKSLEKRIPDPLLFMIGVLILLFSVISMIIIVFHVKLRVL